MDRHRVGVSGGNDWSGERSGFSPYLCAGGKMRAISMQVQFTFYVSNGAPESGCDTRGLVALN